MRILIALLTAFAIPVWGHDITYPIFTGTLHVTAENDSALLEFASQHDGKVVFLDLEITYSFSGDADYTVNDACNAENEFWNDGFTDNRFVMPLTVTGPRETLTIDDVTCADLPMTFTGVEIPLSSGGPGAHWYEIQGFFLMRERVDRWPYLELRWLEVDAATWANVLDRGTKL
ncbi:MAG: hypothetical protein AAF198_01820 [Pseudomonadota bacterium]